MRPGKAKAVHAGRSSLFLIELILAVAYMALASTVCVRLYLYAHNLSTDSAIRTHAITEVQNIFTAFRTGEGTPEDTLRAYLEIADTSLENSDILSLFSEEIGDTGREATVSLAYGSGWKLIACGAEGSFSSGSTEGTAEAFHILLRFRMDPDSPGITVLSAEVRNSRQNPARDIYTSECRRYNSAEYTAPAPEQKEAAEE